MHSLAFLLLPELSNLGLAAATEPLFVANWLSQKPLFQWHAVSADGEAVRASNGRLVAVDGDLSAARDCSTVFVLASFEPSRVARARPVLRWLRGLARAGIEIGGIENGSQVLAEAGLLDGHMAAVHWDNLAGFRERYPRVSAGAHRYRFGANRITCAGAAATLDMMIAWIERRADPDLAEEVARHLLLDQVRGPDNERRPLAGARDIVVARAQALMRAKLDEPLACPEIARSLRLSLRQLERRFRQTLDRSVHAEYLSLRIERAHQYLQQTELSVMQVAVACGFRSPEYFSRLYRRQFGCQPRTDRRQSTSAPVFRGRSGKASR